MFARKFLLYFVTLLTLGISFCKAVAVTEKCTKDEDCDDNDEKTECDTVLQICLCNRNHFLVREAHDTPATCEPIRLAIGETCKVKEQCTHGIPGTLSDCVPNTFDGGNSTERICHCNDNEAVYDPIEKDCHLKRNYLGDDCKVDSQCNEKMGNLSFCYFVTECQCHIEAVAGRNNTYCLPLANQIGEECEERQQCTEGKPGNYSDCVEGGEGLGKKVCKCLDGTEADLRKHECVKKGEVAAIAAPGDTGGQSCNVDGDCPGKTTGCGKNGKCGCLGGFFHSRHKEDCLEIRNELGESCLESQQCQRGKPGMLSACLLGECRCTNFSVIEQGGHFCHRKAVLVGDPCHINEQCWGNLGEKSLCVGGKCECEKGSEALDDYSKCV